MFLPFNLCPFIITIYDDQTPFDDLNLFFNEYLVPLVGLINRKPEKESIKG